MDATVSTRCPTRLLRFRSAAVPTPSSGAERIATRRVGRHVRTRSRMLRATGCGWSRVVHNAAVADAATSRSLLASRSVFDSDLDRYTDNVAQRDGVGAKCAQWRTAWAEAADTAAQIPGTRAAVNLARGQGMVLSVGQARSVGVTVAGARRLLREGLWTAPRRGVLSVLPAADERDDFPHGRRPEVGAAAAALAQPDTVVSHESAALMCGLPVLRWPARPVLTARNGNGAGRWESLVHKARLSPDEITTWFGAQDDPSSADRDRHRAKFRAAGRTRRG